jgi:hypothetical protein
MFRSPNSSILGGALRRQIGELAGALGINRPLPGRGNVDISGQYLVGGSQIKTANLGDVVSTAGSWIPTDGSGGGLTLTAVNCIYARVGPIFFIFADLSYPTTSDTHNAVIAGLPFNTQATSVNFDVNGTVMWNGSGNLYWALTGGSQLVFANNLNFNQVANSALSGARLRFAFAAV